MSEFLMDMLSPLLLQAEVFAPMLGAAATQPDSPLIPKFITDILSAPILFFFLGFLAKLVKSDLEIPPALGKAMSLYLLMAIGFEGGYKLATEPITMTAVLLLGFAVLSTTMVPIWTFFIFRKKLGSANAAALAATYGSISAVTFITATNFLNNANIEYGGYMVAAMALMESPAIIAGVLLWRLFPDKKTETLTISEQPITNRDNSIDLDSEKIHWGELLKDAFLNGAVVVLLGALVIGLFTGKEGWKDVEPFMKTPFKGVLCFFLLEMGLLAARRIGDLIRGGFTLSLFGVASPPIHASMGILAAWVIGATHGDALLLAVLVGSASYIAVPAAMQLAIPKANPSLYVPMSLAITFPFNIIIGIPLYNYIIKVLW